MSFLSRMTETSSERELRSLLPTVKKVIDLEDDYRSLTDTELFSITEKLKELIANGASKDEILPHAFAACREATYRRTGKRQYPSQILAATAMVNNAVAEMMTGQGKSLVIPLKAYFDSLYGNVNVVTSNDYLAERDSEEAKKIFDALGTTVSHITQKSNRNEKRNAYQSNIVYSTVQQLGFDYLRDHLVKDGSSKVMTSLDSLIIDEMDSILFDQGMTPLVLSGEELPINNDYLQKAKILANQLIAPLDTQQNSPQVIKRLYTDEFELYDKIDNLDFYFSKETELPVLTAQGIQKIENFFKISADDQEKWPEVYSYMLNALTARDLKLNDRYIIENGKIVLIDKTTDRKLHDNNFSYGLHQALEAKENLEITPIRNTDSSITISSFIKKFTNISGTSGTAFSEYDEFIMQYDKSVVKIPHYKEIPAEMFATDKFNLPKMNFKTRTDHPTTICNTKTEKYNAIIEQIIICNLKEQPVLVGTISIDESEQLNKIILMIQQELNKIYNQMYEQGLINKDNLNQPLTDDQKNFLMNHIISIKDKTLLTNIKTIINNSSNLNDLFKLCSANINLLNAKNDKIESLIVANAGKANSITISTNMAGRGTDIPLGGSVDPEVIGTNIAMNKIKKMINNQFIIDECLLKNYDELQDDRLKEIKSIIEQTIKNYQEKAKETLNVEDLKHQVDIEKEKVIQSGGLFVIGSSYHNSRRINDQLRGRSGRQTDNGESKFFVSLEDSLLSQISKDDVDKVKIYMEDHQMSRSNEPKILQLFEKAQAISEANDMRQRLETSQYDSFVDICRTGFYEERDTLLDKNIPINEIINNMINKVVTNDITNAIQENKLNDIVNSYSELIGIDLLASTQTFNKNNLISTIINNINDKIIQFDQEYNLYHGQDKSSEMKRTLLLDMMDSAFQEFMNEKVDDIKQQVSLLNTGGGNKDPKVEFAISLSKEYENTTLETRKQLISNLIQSIDYYHRKNEKLGYYPKK